MKKLTEKVHNDAKNKFMTYFIDIETHKNIERATEIFQEFFSLDKAKLKVFLRAGVCSYNNVPYHNATHGLNTLYSGSIYLMLLQEYQISYDKKLIFLLCCYLHDIGHPGLGDCNINSINLEKHHISLIKELVSQHNDLLQIDTNESFVLIEELVLATSLSYHNTILQQFKEKYYAYNSEECIVNDKTIGTIELMMMIVLADISTVYKAYDNFAFGSEILDKEIRSAGTDSNYDKHKEDLTFIDEHAIPLAKYFSGVFTEFQFILENALENAKKLKIKQ